MPMKTHRKILQSGGSRVVTLPPDWLRIYNLDVGDTVEIIYGSIVIIKPKDMKLDLDFIMKELKLITEALKNET